MFASFSRQAVPGKTNCRDKFCVISKYRIKKTKQISKPCSVCSLGTLSDTSVCPQCGQARAYGNIKCSLVKRNF